MSRTPRPAWLARAAALAVSAATAATVCAAPAGAAEQSALGYDPVTAKGSLFHVADVVGAHDSYRAGYTGKGVGIALIDTGVTPVAGLDTGNVVQGPDLSLDSQDPELAHLDAYGHGTHLASLMVGRDAAGTPASYLDPARFTGIAPDAHLLSVKVGASDGAVDVSQVIAAINWVVEHKDDAGLNIRVINLSYGTDSTQDSRVDPLAYAVENAWRNGVVVVAAGGNDGSDNFNLANPARDPYVLAVGAADTQGTVDTADDTVPAWATRGTNQRHVDVVAPGVSVLGLRVPNGYADERNPAARVGTRFAKASGTSQAAAVVSAEVALLLQQNPQLTPDQVKKHLMTTAQPFRSTPVQHRGSGVTDVAAAQSKPAPSVTSATQGGASWSTGTGSLEAARGTSHVFDGTAELRGEVDLHAVPWNPQAYADDVAAGTVWNGGDWRGSTWTGSTWTGSTWTGSTWTGSTWTGSTWTGSTWTGSTWTGGTWAGAAWSGSTWSGKTWRSGDWAGKTWRDGSWSGSTWSGKTWRDSSWSGSTWSGKTWRSADLASDSWT